MCPRVEQGETCPDEESCPFAHSVDELRATPMLFRTVICSWWKRGECEYGDGCRFAHGEHQLRRDPAEEKSEVDMMEDSMYSTTAAIDTPPLEQEYTTETPSDRRFTHVYNAILNSITSTSLSLLDKAAIAQAAASAAIESLDLFESVDQDLILSAAGLTGSPPSMPIKGNDVIEAELNKFRKGFASSPALLTFLAAYEDATGTQSRRPRADSDPAGDIFLEELEKLWINPNPPLMRSDPFLSASHMTLDNYLVNDD